MRHHTKLITIAFYAIFLVFIIFYIQRLDFSSINSLRFDWFYLALSIIFSLMFRYWGVYIWVTILRGIGAKNIGSFSTLSAVYAKSWLGRYLPGNVWVIGKVYFASQHGISKTKLVVSSMLEGALQVLVIIDISLIFILVDDRLTVLSSTLKFILVGAAVTLSALMTPPVFNHLISAAYFLIKKRHLDTKDWATVPIVLRASAQYGFGAILTGTSYFFLSRSITNTIRASDFLFLIDAFNLAGAIGILSFFTPSGLGVREGILLMLLGTVMPSELAIIITVVSRIWSLMMDLVFFASAQLLQKVKL